MKTIEGQLNGKGVKLAIVVSRFNELITDSLLKGAVDMYRRLGGDEADLTAIHVPGAFELPLVASKAAESGKYDAVICLGCVIRGSTSHYDHVVAGATQGIAQASLDTGVPVIFGVLTTETIEQATERAGTKQGNNGAKAVMAALDMVSVMKQL